MLYQYKAKDEKGNLKTGSIETENEDKVYLSLKKQGLFLLSIKEKGATQKISFNILNRVSLKTLAIFTKELQVMIKAGLPLVTALKTLEEQMENKTLKKIVSKLAQEVEGGTPLSEALGKYPNVFSPFYINTLTSGEKGGSLDSALQSLATQLEKDYDLNSTIRGAMVYPAFILLALFAVIIIILIYVVPSLTNLFTELSGTLPITLRILISSSSFVRSFWWLIIIALVGIYLLLKFWKKTPSGSHFLDNLKIQAPGLGSLIRKIYLTRFCRTTSTLIKAGLPIVDVLETTKSVISNTIYQKEINNVQKKVEGGIPLSSALKQSNFFPPMLYQLITVGENTGNIEQSLDTLADFYEKDVTSATVTLVSLIEPALIIIIGLAVAIVVISVMKPIYGVLNTL